MTIGQFLRGIGRIAGTVLVVAFVIFSVWFFYPGVRSVVINARAWIMPPLVEQINQETDRSLPEQDSVSDSAVQDKTGLQSQEVASVHTNNGGGPYYGGSPECTMSTGDAKTVLGVDVERLTNEPCSFNWRGAAVSLNIESGWILTVDLADRSRVLVYDGDLEGPDIVEAYAFTARYKPGFNLDDAVHNSCALLAKEQLNGSADNPPFEVWPGNFTCGDWEPFEETEKTTVSCPMFGEIQTVPMSDGGCNLEWDEEKGTQTDFLPDGWSIICDIEGKNSNGSWTCGSASLYPPD